MFKKMYKPSIDYLFTYLESHKKQWQKLWERMHLDSWESEVEEFLNALERDIGSRIFDEGVVGFSVKKYANRLSELFLTFAQGDFARQMEKILGQRIYGGTEWWQTIKKGWITELEIRARSTATDSIFQARQYVFRSIREGHDFNTILEGLRNRFSDLSENRLKFLARDLTGTMNATIQQYMHLSVGIEHYIWNTQADERVRGRPGGLYSNVPVSHWEMEGLLCKWNDPAVYSDDYGKTWLPKQGNMPKMHVGLDYNCRCLATPWLSFLVKEVDDEAA
jgi:uncharacterized protein with gpF-like domain